MNTKIQIKSDIPNGVVSKYGVDSLEYCNIVYMCIKQKGCSEYQIPQNLELLVNQILGDIYQLSPELYDNDWTKYCYLTIKKQYITPNSIGNREGWHIDGFKSDQENFIWFDCPATPTEVSLGGFTLTDDCAESLLEMEYQANIMFHHQLKPNVLYEMNQNCVHRPTYNKTKKSVLRTFIKLTFTDELFNCIGNAWNYKLPHIKPTTPRKEIRNHGVI